MVGARPQFIKAAVVCKQLETVARIEHVLVHTGQHYDHNMSRRFFEELGIGEPKYDLGVRANTHGAQTGRMIEELEAVFSKERPDWVVVYGDTNSTLAGALAAVKLHIPVAHVEAGLRSFNRRMPEEINRVLTDHASDLLFAPTSNAVANLRQEGIPEERIHFVGDVMYDAALYYASEAQRKSVILDLLGLKPGAYILATVHRAENTDMPERLRIIVEGLAQVARQIPVVFPAHPRTRKALEAQNLIGLARAHLRLIDPVGYLDMVMLERHARLIATDSGGVQREAFFYRVPCVTLRGETEWVELVDLGWNRLCLPVSGAVVAEAIVEMMGKRGVEATPYGDGKAAQRIVAKLSGETV